MMTNMQYNVWSAILLLEVSELITIEFVDKDS